MSINNIQAFKLSERAISFLASHKVPQVSKISLDTDYIFQIEKATKNNLGIYNCTLFDKDAKYAGFFGPV